MYKIIDNLYVGTVKCVPIAEEAGFSILGACKDPLHRQHAKLSGSDVEGYITKSMPKNEPEYYYAEREHALYCNLIDADVPKYIQDNVISRALCFIEAEIRQGRNVLIVCNKAQSRSPSIAFMWLIVNGYFKDIQKYEDAVLRFTKEFYPLYNPAAGIYEYTMDFFNKYNQLTQNQEE